MTKKVDKDEEWKIELKKQKEEIEEEVNPIINNKGNLSYEEYMERLLHAFERAKENYCKRHGITKEEYYIEAEE